MEENNVFSFGGGAQSTAALVLAAQGRIPYHRFAFANVGSDSENPDTLEYVERYSIPFARANGLQFVTLEKEKRGQPITLLQEIYKPNHRVPIPAFLPSGAPGNRICTQEFKIEVVNAWCKRQHIEWARIGIGFSIDEIHRCRTQEWTQLTRKFAVYNDYPLVDLRLNRSQCVALVVSAGLPEPPKSACWFCPYHSTGEWYRLRANHPALFQRAVQVERQLQHNRAVREKDTVYLHYSLKPLEVAIGDQTMMDLEPETTCNLGSCMT